MPKEKSKKTYSLMIEYEGKVYYLRSIDNCEYYSKDDGKHIFRLTDKATSAKRWKSEEALIKSILTNSLGAFVFSIGRDDIPFQSRGIWHNIITPKYQECIKQQSNIIKNLKPSNTLIGEATRLIEITKVMNIYEGLLDDNCKNKFEIVDSSHNFRKIKLEQINKLFEKPE